MATTDTTPKVTTITEATTSKVTMATTDTTPEVSNITGATTSKVTMATTDTTPKVTTTSEDKTFKETSTSEATTPEVSTITGATTPKVTTTTEASTPKVAKTTIATSPEVITTTEATTPKLTTPAPTGCDPITVEIDGNFHYFPSTLYGLVVASNVTCDNGRNSAFKKCDVVGTLWSSNYTYQSCSADTAALLSSLTNQDASEQATTVLFISSEQNI